MTKQALVTGAASGIGLAVSRQLCNEGWSVTGLDISPAPDERVFADWLACDLSDAGQVGAASTQLRQRALPFDALVFSAGVAGIGDAAQVLQINFLAARAMLRELAPAVADDGSITLLSSGAGWRWMDRRDALLAIHREPVDEKVLEAALASCADAAEAYVRSKELLTSLAAFACLDQWKRGVRTNAVSPGSVATPLIADFTRSMGAQAMDFSRQTVGRDGTVDEIAEVIAFLASPAARWINGADIRTDGGLTGALASGIAQFEGWT
jgi:NAD(P)-dependent dehydrogenase (short-subunit alcohol dehydrogenase family)